MKISRNWLQSFFEAPLPDAQTLTDALMFHAFEIESVESIAGDDVLDVKVTANRGHDCLSHRGIAKELAAILKLPIRTDPLRQARSIEKITDAVAIEIATPLCARYIAGYIKGVKVAPSPQWLRSALESIGQRSINNVVDATNYVMFHIGQPLHAFDAAKLQSRDSRFKIQVREAKKGERLLALDDNEYELDPSMLVIVDGNAALPAGGPIGIAGVKGGKPAGVDESTTDIILESANFDGASVRRTVRSLGLRTDASDRFQQMLSPELALYGIKEAADLIVKLAGGEIDGFVDAYPKTQQNAEVAVSVHKVNHVLGTEFSSDRIADILNRLDVAYAQVKETFTVKVPFERLDLVPPEGGPEDLIEEIGRIIGYDEVPTRELPSYSKAPEVNQLFAAAERVREDLMDKGYSEVFTSVFSEKGERAIANKIDGERPFLRSSLLPGLEAALVRNVRNKELLGLKEVRLFEIGTIWKKKKEEVVVATISEKEKGMESPLSKLAANVASYEDLPTSKTERYTPFSRYPFIVRDIALWVPSGTVAESILAVIRAHAGDLLVRSELFDTFEKEGKVSYAFRLVFQSFERTLTDGEANERMQAVTDALRKSGYEIR